MSEDSDIHFYKEFFMILGGILIGGGLAELISLTPLTNIDKIILLISGGVLLMIAGQDLLNRRFREFFKSLIFVALAFIVILILRLIF